MQLDWNMQLDWTTKDHDHYVETFAEEMRRDVPALENASDLTLAIIAGAALRRVVETDRGAPRGDHADVVGFRTGDIPAG